MLILNKECFVILIIGFVLALSASNSEAANKPCSGKMGGIAYCVEGKFLCNNGKFSRSKKVCNPKIYGSGSNKDMVKKNRREK